jgi:hypothetical protein
MVLFLIGEMMDEQACYNFSMEGMRRPLEHPSNPY